jgi:hypothetical protein
MALTKFQILNYLGGTVTYTSLGQALRNKVTLRFAKFAKECQA